MKPPCIIVVRYILPAIRVLIARELVEKHGLKRVRAAERMGITPAAVTQYLKKVRGETKVKMVEDSDEAVKIISDLANNIANDEASPYDILQNICKICQIMRSQGLLCEMHKEMLPILQKNEVCECDFRLPCKT